MDEKDWYDVDVITCAAPNLRERPSNRFNLGNGDRAVKVSDRKLLEIHKKRLTRILDVAALNGNEVVILGAFGCGAFQNKPEVVARAAKEAMADYLHAFKTIEFAVYCPPIDRTMKSGEIAQEVQEYPDNWCSRNPEYFSDSHIHNHRRDLWQIPLETKKEESVSD